VENGNTMVFLLGNAMTGVACHDVPVKRVDMVTGYTGMEILSVCGLSILFWLETKDDNLAARYRGH